MGGVVMLLLYSHSVLFHISFDSLLSVHFTKVKVTINWGKQDFCPECKNKVSNWALKLNSRDSKQYIHSDWISSPLHKPLASTSHRRFSEKESQISSLEVKIGLTSEMQILYSEKCLHNSSYFSSVWKVYRCEHSPPNLLSISFESSCQL